MKYVITFTGGLEVDATSEEDAIRQVWEHFGDRGWGIHIEYVDEV